MLIVRAQLRLQKSSERTCIRGDEPIVRPVRTAEPWEPHGYCTEPDTMCLMLCIFIGCRLHTVRAVSTSDHLHVPRKHDHVDLLLLEQCLERRLLRLRGPTSTSQLSRRRGARSLLLGQDTDLLRVLALQRQVLEGNAEGGGHFPEVLVIADHQRDVASKLAASMPNEQIVQAVVLLADQHRDPLELVRIRDLRGRAGGGTGEKLAAVRAKGCCPNFLGAMSLKSQLA